MFLTNHRLHSVRRFMLVTGACMAALFFFMLYNAHGADTLIVKASKARIRHGPGSQFNTAYMVTKGYPLEKIGQNGDWIKIRDPEGDEGWIHKSLVKETDIVVVKNKIVNIRKGPGTNNPVVMQCEQGVVLRVLERKKSWIKVQHADGETGWIHRNLVWE